MLVTVQSYEDAGMEFSDAYVYFWPDQIEELVGVLREAGHPGDILDIRSPLTPDQYKLVRAVAKREGWAIGNDAGESD